MKFVLCGVAFLAAALIGAAQLSAASATAQVSALEGKATRSRGGAPAALSVGAAVGQGDTISTEPESRLELKFSDASVIRIGQKAKLQLTEAHFGGGPTKRKLTAKLFFGNLWAKVTSAIQGDAKFAVETENAVAGVRGTVFRVDAHEDKSVLVSVYDGAVAVAKPGAAPAKPGERHEVEGPAEISRDQWEKIVGAQMQVLISADGTPGEPTKLDPNADDAFAKWNEARDKK
ncbi:MAG TPA: FecR family protein [Myxococcales bacterium]|nr:FecR family protein [Myxococcales bacterium]